MTDKLIQATQPLSSAGADEIIQTPAEGADDFEDTEETETEELN